MSAVAYNLGYDTRMIKTRKNMVTVRLLAVIKEKQLHKTYILYRPKNIKISKHTTSCHTVDNLICDHGTKPFLESFLSFYI